MAHGRQNKRNVRKGDEIMNQWSKAYLEVAVQCIDEVWKKEEDEGTLSQLFFARQALTALLDNKEEQ